MTTSSTEDLYRTLQVEPQADLEAIRAAYRRLARQFHPDRNPLPEAAARMRAINAAYAILSDPSKRATYDARRYLPHVAAVRSYVPTPSYPRRTPVVVPVSPPPTPLQRRVDRIVAVLGVLLLIGIGFYAVNVIPYAERQFQSDRQYRPPAAQAGGLATAQTAARQPGSEHTPRGSVPERLRADAALQGFPGTVLVAPTTLEPFAGLPILRLDATGQGIARYAVYYGDLTNGGAAISGLVGRASFDSNVPHLADCAAEAPYCTGPVGGQTSGPAGLELFRASDLVEDYPAFIVHRVCCNGVFWSLSWYEPQANMSYTIDLSRSVASRFGSPLAEADAGAARAVAGLAVQLVRLS